MSLKTVCVAVAVAGAVLLSGQAAAGGEVQPVPASLPGPAIDRSIARRMQDARIVGLGAAIIVNRKLVWTRGYGFADKERGVPFTKDTIMNIGSISKTITGAALMRAVQDGKLSLDEDITKYLPFKVANPFFPDEPITLRQLATHTSGITDRGAVYAAAYHFGRDSPEALGGFLRDYLASDGKNYSKENFLSSKPGTHREYSNIGAGLAGYIVELAVGEKFNVYTKQTLFAPLKMKNTGWLMSEVDLAKHSNLYIAQGLAVPIQLYGLTTYPDGGLRTSVEDLSRFFIALLDGGASQGVRILDKESVDEMLRFQFSPANKPDNVKLSGEGSLNSGIFWATKESLARIGHNGADPGLVTMMLSDVDKQIGVILFVNTAATRQEDGEASAAIFEDLWQLALELKGARAK
ncbi:MAG: serine hydrolase domain-containing protein [Archangium sp.]|nr:serine hydrolase domain-containing protein [Archangium sp.]